jgi:hypothetical protein
MNGRKRMVRSERSKTNGQKHLVEKMVYNEQSKADGQKSMAKNKWSKW